MNIARNKLLIAVIAFDAVAWVLFWNANPIAHAFGIREPLTTSLAHAVLLIMAAIQLTMGLVIGRWSAILLALLALVPLALKGTDAEGVPVIAYGWLPSVPPAMLCIAIGVLFSPSRHRRVMGRRATRRPDTGNHGR